MGWDGTLRVSDSKNCGLCILVSKNSNSNFFVGLLLRPEPKARARHVTMAAHP